jgi:GTP-binding protein EngB required for normal cell division
MDINVKFEAKEISLRVDQVVQELSKLLLKTDTPDLDKLQENLLQDIKDHQESDALTVAFVGQYNAGKSTTISALTGRRDIRIDSDVATDKTSGYDWNGIKIIDTPGLFADREDHDDITYNAIARADLLVFCLTYMLFDSITVANFKKLAYENKYQWKMMLLVNKMSDEAGESDQKIANYTESLAVALKPNNLNEFSLSFIDARDYCEGCDSDDELLQEISFFPEFINTLNKFLRDKGSLAKLDTPIRIALGCLDDAKSIIHRDKVKDDTFFELLNRLKRRADKSRSHLAIHVTDISVDMYGKIITEGDHLADCIGKDKNLESKVEFHLNNVRQFIQEANVSVQHKVEEEIRTIQEEVDKLKRSDLFLAFQSRLEAAEENKVSMSDFDLARLREQVEAFRDISKETTIIFGGLGIEAIDTLFGLEELFFGGAETFLDLGGLLDFLGPVVAIAGGIMAITKLTKQQEIDEKVISARLEVQRKFAEIARESEKNFKGKLKNFEDQFYGKIYNLVSEAKRKEEEEIAASSEIMKKLLVTQKKLETVRQDLASISR